MSDNTHPTPSPDLAPLSQLIGTWQITGGTTGTVTYEWMEGQFFLMQHVELEQYGQLTKGIEIIGHLRPFGEAPSEHIKSRYYDNHGNTLDYTYEMVGSTLTIWGGDKGSPAYFKGTLSEDGNRLEGA
jgi:hypothetical protein